MEKVFTTQISLPTGRLFLLLPISIVAFFLTSFSVHGQESSELLLDAPDANYTLLSCMTDILVYYDAYIDDPELATNGMGTISADQLSGPVADDFFLSATTTELNEVQIRVRFAGALTEGEYNFDLSYQAASGATVTRNVNISVTKDDAAEQFIAASDVEFSAGPCGEEADVTYSFYIYDCSGFDDGQLAISVSDLPTDLATDVKGYDLLVGLGPHDLNVINGAEAVQVILTATVPLGIGNINIAYRGATYNPKLTVSFSFDVDDLVLVCNGSVNVTLDEFDCTAPLLPDNVLEGFSTGQDCADGYYVKVLYPYDGFSIDRVRKCGEFKYIAYEINGLPDWIDGEPDATNDYLEFPDREICWGFVNAEDKAPPLACIRKVVALHKKAVQYDSDADYFLSNKAPKEIDGQYWIYDPVTCDDNYPADVAEEIEAAFPNGCSDMILNQSFLSDPNTNLLICTDVDSIYNIADSWSDKSYVYYTGSPSLFDNCSGAPPVIVSVSDILEDYECNYQYDPCVGRLIAAVINRTFVFEDEKGNQNEVVQTICFYKPIITLPTCKETLDVCEYGDTDQENTESLLAPSLIGSVPYFKNGACMTMELDEHICNVTVAFEDLILPGPEKCGFKIIRNWTIFDWCWSPLIYVPDGLSEPVDLLLQEYDDCPPPLFTDWQNKTFNYEQHIVIGDDELPVIECPEYYYNDEPSPIVVSTGPFDCETGFEIPEPTVSNSECGYTWTVEIWTYIPVLWQGVPTGQYELVNFNGANIIEDIDTEAWVTNSVNVAGVPKGYHQLVYIVEDRCGNTNSSDYCPLFVIDEIEPVAVCDDDLTVSVSAGDGGNSNPYGFGRVLATTIDEGSWDNCSDVWLQVRRFVPEACVEDFRVGSDLTLEAQKVTIDKPGTLADGQTGYWTVWADYIDVVCCDIGLHPEEGKVLVELGVWDNANMSRDDKGEAIFGDKVEVVFGEHSTPFVQEDNFNTCWLEVLVEDKIDPQCTAPHDLYLDCQEIPYYASIPEDPNVKWSDLSETEQANLQQWFDEISDAPQALDNCDVTIELVDVRFAVHCKAGYIERQFQAVDAWGQTSDICRQRIYLSRHHDYCIQFPKDVEAQCLEDPNIPGVELFEYACDLLAVSIRDEQFDVPSSNEECYKLFRTYRVINWCQFEEDVDPATPLFDRFDTEFDLEPLVVGRDEDGDGKPGDEDVFVRFMGWETDADLINEIDRVFNDYGVTIGYESYDYNTEGTYGITYIDKDCDPFNYENYNPFDGYWRHANYSRGFYQYTQVIKVTDGEAPILTISGESDFPSFVSPDEDDKLDAYSNGLPTACVGPVELEIGVTEFCTPDAIELKHVYLLPNPALGVGTILLYEEGVVTDDGKVFDFGVSGSGSNFVVSGSFPIGSHELEILAMDGCGNADADFVTFTVYDAKAPSPICISGLSVDLIADGTGGGAATIWASDFLASEIWDCSEPVKYTIHRAEVIDSLLAADEPITPDYETDAALTLDCNDEEVVVVYVYAWDASGMGDRCEALVLITDFEEFCDPESSSLANVAGMILTEEDETVANVEVNLSGSSNSNTVTPNSGEYTFGRLPKENDYTITPIKDIDHANGVSTFDLVVIARHILGTKPLTSVYKLIAADVNNSLSISTLDLIQLRKLILNINVEFRNNTSWRFVDANYKFKDETDPWAEPFPEVININNLNQNIVNGDFIAIKVGDVTGDAIPNEQMINGRNQTGLLNIATQDQLMTPGNLYEIPFFVEALDQITGYQFTLEFGQELNLIDVKEGVTKAEHFGLAQLDNQAITTSWNRSEDGLADNAAHTGRSRMFSLTFSPNAPILLSDAIRITSRYTVAEAYPEHFDGVHGLLDVSLNFADDLMQEAALFQVEQNQPNPFSTETLIRFTLPKAQEVEINILDLTGRTVQAFVQDFEQGANQFRISKHDLPIGGVFFYQVKTEQQEVTKKMILLE